MSNLENPFSSRHDVSTHYLYTKQVNTSAVEGYSPSGSSRNRTRVKQVVCSFFSSPEHKSAHGELLWSRVICR